ncbi:MAG: hypothetical protein ABI992_03660 [Chthoniobacterales bacterium]
MKFTALAIVAAGVLAAGSAFAGEKACCAQHAKNDKTACASTFASLDLTAKQKSEMEALSAACDKSGCTQESRAKMEKSAQRILSKKQFASWKSACQATMSEKKES